MCPTRERMSAATTASWIAIIVAAVAVAASSILSARDLRAARQANHLPILVGLLEQQRATEFLAAEEYILDHISGQPIELGFSALPQPLKDHAWRVTLYYQGVACLVEFGLK